MEIKTIEDLNDLAFKKEAELKSMRESQKFLQDQLEESNNRINALVGEIYKIDNLIIASIGSPLSKCFVDSCQKWIMFLSRDGSKIKVERMRIGDMERAYNVKVSS